MSCFLSFLLISDVQLLIPPMVSHLIGVQITLIGKKNDQKQSTLRKSSRKKFQSYNFSTMISQYSIKEICSIGQPKAIKSKFIKTMTGFGRRSRFMQKLTQLKISHMAMKNKKTYSFLFQIYKKAKKAVAQLPILFCLQSEKRLKTLLQLKL